MTIVFGKDITTEILLRLPIKSVLRFKLVSKLWFSIVSSGSFRQFYSSKHISSPKGILLKKDMNSSCYGLLRINNDHSYYYEPTGGGNFICKSSSNGLLLLKSTSRSPPSRDQTYYICNPTTNECKALIGIPRYIQNNELVWECLVFDPLKSPHYEVVILTKTCSSATNTDIYVYSSMTGKTCKSPLPRYTPAGSTDYFGISFNGSRHWLSLGSNEIIYCDVDNSKPVKYIRMPTLNNFKHICYIGECRGRLYIVKSQVEDLYWDRSCLLNVYVLNSDYSGWSLKGHIDLASTASKISQLFVEDNDRSVPPIHFPCAIFGIFCDEEEELSMVILGDDMLVAYNLRKKITRRLCKMPKPNHLYYSNPYWRNIHQYIPTLAVIQVPPLAGIE